MDYWRQTDIVDIQRLRELRVTLIGVGGIGSTTALCLAKMGVGQLILIDDDTVETQNHPSTMHPLCELMAPKVDSMKKEILRHTHDTHIETYFSRAAKRNIEGGIIISGVDSMSSRKEIWSYLKYNITIPLYIDGRMAGQIGRVLTVSPCTPSHIEYYEANLFDDNEAPEAVCTNRAIIYNTFMIASLICAQVKHYVMGEVLDNELIFDFVTNTLLKTRI